MRALPHAIGAFFCASCIPALSTPLRIDKGALFCRKTCLLRWPVCVAPDPLIVEEEVNEMVVSVYHRPVLGREVVELLEPKPVHLIVDGTCGGGGHTEALLVGGADVLAWIRTPTQSN